MKQINHNTFPRHLEEYQKKCDAYYVILKENYKPVFQKMLDIQKNHEICNNYLEKNPEGQYKNDAIQFINKLSDEMNGILNYNNDFLPKNIHDTATRILQEENSPKDEAGEPIAKEKHSKMKGFISALPKVTVGGVMLRPIIKRFMPQENIAASHLFSGSTGIFGHVKTLAHKIWHHPISTISNLGAAVFHSPAIIALALSGGVVAGGYGLYHFYKNNQREKDIEQIKEILGSRLRDELLEHHDESRDDLLEQAIKETNDYWKPPNIIN